MNRCKKKDRVSILVFRKWNRKHYSIFSTIKRIIIISVLAIVYFFSSPIKGLAAITQDTTETTREYKLDEIEVSAQRSPVLYSQVARIITIINSKEIEAAPAKSIQDLLEYVSGVDVRQRGAEGVQADVNIRGGTFDQTLILLNGINITDPQTGHHNLNIPVSINQVERIEILEGPAARIYGPNAFSGAINIVTKQNASNQLDAMFTGGSFGYIDGEVSGTFKTGRLSNSLAFSGKKSDGYIENTDFSNISGYYSNQLYLKSGKLNFQAGIMEKGFGANSFYTPKYPNQYEQIKSLVSSVKWESYSKIHLTPSVYWRRHQDRFELFRDNPPSWYTTHNYHLTNVLGGNLNSWFNWNFGKTAIGADIRSENIKSNLLGEPLDKPAEVPGENTFFTMGKTRNTFSGFLEHTYYSEKWSFSLGILGTYISESNNGIEVFPGIDIGYQITPIIKIFTSYNTSLRMPTFTDLYYSGPTNIGNPALKPEYASTLEGGLKISTKVLQGHFIGFYRKGKDIIDWVKINSTDKWQPQNITELTGYGAEFRLQTDLSEFMGKFWPEKIEVNYLFNNLLKDDSGYISYYVLDYLKNKINISVSKEVITNLNLDLRISWQQREGTYTLFANGSYGKEADYDPFWLIDGKINYQLKGFTFFVSATNILNTNYIDIGNVIQPGIWLKSGVSWHIEFR